MDAMKKQVPCLGALALELRPGARAGLSVLDQEAAGELAGRIAQDLAGFAPGLVSLDLGLVAALFDPVELLRPGWPLHAELDRLVVQAPNRANARIVAFGGRNGELPESLRPDPDYAEGALRLLPFVVRGESNAVAEVAARFEETLLETGMAGAATALLAQERFGAMMALQYEHAGLAAVWPLIETALLAGERETWLDAPPEPLIRLAAGQARIALFDDDAWNAQGYAPPDADAMKLERAFERFQMRQRQIAALLEAHGIAVTFDHCPAGQDARAILRA
jgi:hypothetical protein